MVQSNIENTSPWIHHTLGYLNFQIIPSELAVGFNVRKGLHLSTIVHQSVTWPSSGLFTWSLHPYSAYLSMKIKWPASLCHFILLLFSLPDYIFAWPESVLKKTAGFRPHRPIWKRGNQQERNKNERMRIREATWLALARKHTLRLQLSAS